MRISISNIAWNKEEDLIIQELLLEQGVKGIEIAPTKIWPEIISVSKKDVEQYASFWKKVGIEIPAMQSILFGHPELLIFNDSSRALTTQYIFKAIDIASWFNMKNVVFGSPRNRFVPNGLDQKVARKVALDFFKKVAEYSAKKNVFFCIEPNPEIYSSNFLTNTEETASFINEVNNPYLQLHLDAAIMSINKESPEETIIKGSKLLKHFHISEPWFDIIGKSGKVDHEVIAQALNKIKYAGWVSIEMKSGLLDNNIRAVEASLLISKKYYG